MEAALEVRKVTGQMNPSLVEQLQYQLQSQHANEGSMYTTDQGDHITACCLLHRLRVLLRQICYLN